MEFIRLQYSVVKYSLLLSGVIYAYEFQYDGFTVHLYIYMACVKNIMSNQILNATIIRHLCEELHVSTIYMYTIASE